MGAELLTMAVAEDRQGEGIGQAAETGKRQAAESLPDGLADPRIEVGGEGGQVERCIRAGERDGVT